jgi:RNA polymerase sigma-70 factor (ECF subfamily)
MVAVISRQFGLEHVETAEDIVSDTFLSASEHWKLQGLPANPAAWLYAVARQKTLYHFRRNKIFEKKVSPGLRSAAGEAIEPVELDFSNDSIRDSQLRMLFAVCDPAIASESQIGLALRVLCGFSIDEIAEAFLTNKETINKRLYRAREKLRSEKIALAYPPEHLLGERLDNVLRIIYLLFNEGYYSQGQNEVMRKDLCLEAIRLGLLLADFSTTSQPRTHALIALMCFHASRFEARQDGEGYILYEDQDEARWNRELINQGCTFLELAARGEDLSSYHLEAGIAFWHCQKEESREKWKNILHYYDLLLQLHYSSAAALNRLVALSKVEGKEVAIEEANNSSLPQNLYYHILMGDLWTGVDNAKAKQFLEEAGKQARTPGDVQGIRSKLEKIK